MAVTVTLSTDKAQYVKGETITVTLNVDGQEPGGEKVVNVAAVVEVAGTEYSVQQPITITWPAAPVNVLGVTCPGVTFQQAGDVFTWTGVAA